MDDLKDLDKTLARLKAAKGDPDAMALATVDFVLDTYSPGFALALEAASIPHWFNESILKVLLDESLPEEADWFNQLLNLAIVEDFRTYDAWNVHEVTRLALRNRLAKEKPERFLELGNRAASHFSGEANHQNIERIYHLLTAKPNDGALELRKLYRRWMGTGELEQMQALGVGLMELTNRDLLQPLAQAYALTALLNIQSNRVGINEQMATAREAVDLNKQLGDIVGLVDSYCGLGQVLYEKGNYTDAQSAFEQARESLDIWNKSESGYNCLDELADIHTSMGRTLAAQGDRAQALVEFEAALSVRNNLYEIDPQDIVNRRNLAVAHVDLGDALTDTDRNAETEKYFNDSLDILNELPEELKSQDIKSDIGKIHSRLATQLALKGEFESGEGHVKEAWEIFQQLLSTDPDNFGLRYEVANVHRTFSAFHLISQEPKKAEKSLLEAQKILNELVEADPTNPIWKGYNASLIKDIGYLKEQQNLYKDAMDEYLAAEKLLTGLTKSNPDSVSWLLHLANTQASLGNLLISSVQVLDRKESETLLLRLINTLYASMDTHSALVERDPTNRYWRGLLAKSEQDLAAACIIIAEQIDKGVKIDLETDITSEGWRNIALARYNKSVELYSKLIIDDPSNKNHIPKISTSLTESASILEARGDTENALQTYRTAEKFLSILTQDQPNNERHAARLKTVKEAITRLENSSNQQV